MQTTVTTTITTAIDVDTFEPTHSVEIEGEEGLPTDVIYAAASGGCQATIQTLEESNPALRGIRLAREKNAHDKLVTHLSDLANQEIDDAEFRQSVVALLDA